MNNANRSFRFGTKSHIIQKIDECKNCGRKVGEGISKTAIHHIYYDPDNPKSYTIELCYRCHMQYHNLSGEYGDKHRKKIRALVIKEWGEPSGRITLYKDREKAEKIYSNKYKTGQKALTTAEYEKLMEVVDNIQDELLIKLAVTTGIRREDICSIKINNINIESETLTYYESKKRRTRTIYLQSSVVLLIIKFLKTIKKREELFSFTGRTAYRHLNHFCQIAGIPERPFHALRATCVKFCQKKKWTLEQVSELTGDSIRVLREHYATPSDTEMKEVIQNKPIIPII